MIKTFIKKQLKDYYQNKIQKHQITSIQYDAEKSFKFINNLFQKKQLFSKTYLKEKKEYTYDLSLIVPVYNASAYLKQCLNSLLNQDTKYKYEIIVIDDGSTDDSYTIMKNLQNNNQILKIHKQENQGISLTRNKGLSLSQGRYVGFIDNDDYVDKDYIQILLDAAYKYNADYVRTGYEIFNENNTLYQSSLPFEIINNTQDDAYYKYDGYIWSGIQSRYLWSDFAFPENYWYEDIITRLYLYQKTRIFVNIDTITYHKRAHQNNASLKLWNPTSYNSLDQLQLVLLLDQLRRKQNIPYNNLLYKYELNELGPMLYRRTIKLTEKERLNAFIVAADYLNNKKIDITIDQNDISTYYANLAFKNYDFNLWNLVGAYDKYQKTS